MKNLQPVIVLALIFAVFFCAGILIDIGGLITAPEETKISTVKPEPDTCRVLDGRLEAGIDGIWTDLGPVSEYIYKDALASYTVDDVVDVPPASIIGRVKIPEKVLYTPNYSDTAGTAFYANPSEDGSYTPTPAAPASGDGEDMAPVF